MNRLKQLRSLSGLGYRELSRELEKQGYQVSFMTLSKMEQEPDRDVRWSTVIALARFFKVSAEYLMGGEETIAAHNEEKELPPEARVAIDAFKRNMIEIYAKDDKTR